MQTNRHRAFMCCCGQRHKGTPEAPERRVAVRTLYGDWFLVPLGYIEVHGLRSSDLPLLARRYGWERTSGPRSGNLKKRRTWAK